MIKKAIYILAAIVGLFTFVFFFEDTFPTASLDLQITRTDAVEEAKAYLSELDYDVADYTSSVIFTGDTKKFVFLEKCLGLKEANQRAKSDVPIWFWKVRFFKELQKEGYDVSVNPNGRIDGFSHYLEQSAAGANIAQEDAQKIVESYLLKNDVSLSDLELIESRSKKLENRTDHTFVWKMPETELEWQEEDKVGKGMVRVSVTVHGDQIGAFRAYYWTPESFNRFIRKLFSEGKFLALISSFFYMLLYVAAIIMFIVSFRDAPLHVRLMVSLGLLIGLPNLLNLFNSLPLVKAGYDTKVNYLVYYGSEIIYELKGIINHIVVIIIVFCGGSYLARKLYSERVKGFHSVLEGRPFTKAMKGEIYGGYLFAFMALGFVTTFYYLGMKYCGVWVFPSTRYSNILGTWFPFLLPLSLSIIAAVSEEFIFRMFAISF